ncbi:uncharacterized protein EI90DRAFT_2628548 [Cantharellus anzutake]|uniref:uncharacterized protein n=1 Tax=Cantharellus anzutake TaxID=1750568 RepID=UPI001907D455|nr:uncharacterized protein EI90DRAFT_2628548 [Cantharellus anzutake]KAF8319868.1 hypothetical protein EI90DRAFT_2628548 [Cantharellus anzutake]
MLREIIHRLIHGRKSPRVPPSRHPSYVSTHLSPGREILKIALPCRRIALKGDDRDNEAKTLNRLRTAYLIELESHLNPIPNRARPPTRAPPSIRYQSGRQGVRVCHRAANRTTHYHRMAIPQETRRNQAIYVKLMQSAKGIFIFKALFLKKSRAAGKHGGEH